MIKYRNLVIDPKYRAVILNGKHIELINYEFEILHLLVKSPGQVFYVMSLIRRIRKKIEPNPPNSIYILTV